MDIAADRPTWQWPDEAAKVPSVSSATSVTGREDQNARRARSADGRLTSRVMLNHSEAAKDGQATPTPPGSFTQGEEEERTPPAAAENEPRTTHQERHYKPRACRICLEVVQPTIILAEEGINIHPRPTVEYISEDPSSGRLIRPCLCKGSMRWIHEGCLQEWRNHSPHSPNVWQCPTCHFKYRLHRMDWGRYISSKTTQLALTVMILFVTVFILGFFANPIINLYLDPYDVLTSGGLSEPVVEDGGTWFTHFLKGLASLGLLGAMKSLLAASPWQWFHIRNTGVLGGGRRGRGATGRDRMANISWWLVAFGVMTFLWAVYKFVAAWSRRLLNVAAERVVDVHGNDDDDDDE